MNIYIANDHGGYDLKKQIMVHLQKNKHWVVNEGSDSREIVRYPYYASKVAAAVAEKRADFGILICNTGIGMSMIANKYKGVRAALVTSEETAMLTRQHNDANIICLGGKFTDGETACRLVDIFLNTAFEGGRHNISLGLIEQAEKINFSGGFMTALTPKSIPSTSCISSDINGRKSCLTRICSPIAMMSRRLQCCCNWRNRAKRSLWA